MHWLRTLAAVRRVGRSATLRMCLCIAAASTLTACSYVEQYDKSGRRENRLVVLAPLAMPAPGEQTTLLSAKGVGLISASGLLGFGAYSAELATANADCRLVVFDKETALAARAGAASDFCWTTTIARNE